MHKCTLFFDGTETVVYMFICASKDAQMHKCTVSRIRWNSLSDRQRVEAGVGMGTPTENVEM